SGCASSARWSSRRAARPGREIGRVAAPSSVSACRRSWKRTTGSTRTDEPVMERISRVVGPLATNVHVLADERSRAAIAIDHAIPSLAWIAEELAARRWTLKLIVSTHGHWDHVGDNAAVADATGAQIAVHHLDREALVHPVPLAAPFEIPPCVPAVELAEGGE